MEPVGNAPAKESGGKFLKEIKFFEYILYLRLWLCEEIIINNIAHLIRLTIGRQPMIHSHLTGTIGKPDKQLMRSPFNRRRDIRR